MKDGLRLNGAELLPNRTQLLKGSGIVSQPGIAGLGRESEITLPDPEPVTVIPFITTLLPNNGASYSFSQQTTETGVWVGVGVGAGTVNSNVTQSSDCDESITPAGVKEPNSVVVYGGDVCIVYKIPFVVGI
jgi:hypothetical protein